MFSKPMFFVAIVCTGLLAVGAVQYQRSRAEVAALRAQVGAAPVAAPAPPSPSLGAVQVRPAVADEAQPEEPKGPSLPDRMLAAETLAEAMRLALPLMGDTTDKASDGAMLLSLWAMKHMRWSDVGVPKNETSTARIHKDSDAERGKRLCVGGDIVQIQRERGTPLYSGLLSGYYGAGIINFFALGSTGDLVGDSAARFCGIATGRFTYSNTGGGTTHAITMVGMFDLPENNPARKRRRASSDDE